MRKNRKYEIENSKKMNEVNQSILVIKMNKLNVPLKKHGFRNKSASWGVVKFKFTHKT